MTRRIVPMALRTRPWTPDAKTETGWRMRAKRCCNGCGAELGDVTTEEIDAVINGELPDVRGECPFCIRRARKEREAREAAVKP